MRHLGLIIGILTALGGTANAGVYGDDLAKCLIGKTAEEDRVAFMTYTFVAMAQHPAVRPYASATPEQLDQLQTRAARIMEQSLTEICRAEAISAIRFEGPASIGSAFQAFGAAATSDLMTVPAVAKGLEGVGDKLDTGKLEALGIAAGGAR